MALVAKDSVREPDLAIVKGSRRDYLHPRPVGTNAALVIEVAESSILIDRQKASIYCAAGVPTYWIVNGAEQCLEVFERQSPEAPSYLPQRVRRGSEQVELKMRWHDGGTFTADQLVPPLSADAPR
jgi:Uma2 family endonuclease